jgi:hypothetical protein
MLVSLAGCSDPPQLSLAQLLGDAAVAREDAAPSPGLDGAVANDGSAANDDAQVGPQPANDGDGGGGADAKGSWPDVTFSGHLYVSIFDQRRGGLALYASPLSASSSPVLVLTAANGITGAWNSMVMPDGSRIYVVDHESLSVLGFDLPLTVDSQPVVSIKFPDYPCDLVFDPQGQLWVSAFSGKVFQLAPPITSASVPLLKLRVPAPINNLFAITLSSDGDLLTTGADPGIAVFHPPLTDRAAPDFVMSAGLRYQGLTFHEDNLYATGFYDGIWLFQPPFSSKSFPAKHLPAQGSLSTLVFAPHGELLVANAMNQTNYGIEVYDVASSTLEFTVLQGAVNAYGVAWGP